MYENFYHLERRPFLLNADPAFFYRSHAHKRAIAYLRYGLNQGQGLIVITGEIGTGKTMLVRAMAGALTDSNIVAAEIVSPSVDPEDLLRLIARGFGLDPERRSKAELLGQLEAFFRDQAKAGRRALLVVDEAQNLPRASIEELRMLANFERDGRPLLQSILLGQKELLNASLVGEDMEQVRQRVVAAYHLTPLDPQETGEYVRHRLALAGWKDDPQIDAAVYDRVHEHTGGIPRRINTVFDRLFLFGSIEELHHFDLAAVDAVIAELAQELAPTAEPAEPGAATIDFAGMRLDHRLAAIEQKVDALAGQLGKGLEEIRAAIRRIERQVVDRGKEVRG
ncbi:MAG: XrtA-associated ATPase [Chromatiales bacterium]|nr:XrtA-associated ATPase [Chromatiales bacterium]